jgi:hypothetical protein
MLKFWRESRSLKNNPGIIITKEDVIETIENDANRHFGIRASAVQIQSREAFLQFKNDDNAEWCHLCHSKHGDRAVFTTLFLASQLTNGPSKLECFYPE